MSLYLKKINVDMGNLEYDMFQEIPTQEMGAENEANGLTFLEFKEFIKNKICEETVELTNITAPRITYIMYENDYPIGRVSIRPKLNDYWELHSGHVGFTIRPSARKKGYGSNILKLALKECEKLGINKVKTVCSPKNIASQKVMQNNGAIKVKQTENTIFYEISLGI